MAIKWKDTIKNVLSLVKDNRGDFLGFVALGLWFVGLIVMFRIGPYMLTGATWFLGVAIDLVGGFGLAKTLSFGLHRVYDNRRDEDYDQWKDFRRSLQRRILSVAVPALVVSLVFFFYIASGSTFYYYYNYSLGYFLVFTVLVQYGVCQLVLHRFMDKRLATLIDQLTEVNREQLDKAIEMERQSIEKAAKSEQLKVDLISNVSHDLKTPLTSMVGYIELMKNEDMGDVAKDYLEVIDNKAQKLKEMIESLFSLAKASSGNIDLNLEVVELNMLIEQIFADLADPVRESGLNFIKFLTDKDTHLVSDNLYLYRICQNLIENALKYSAVGTRVFVRTGVEQVSGASQVSLEITNTAGYLMDFQKDDIVERFSRGDKARSSDGNGLGLAIVSTYAAALGGSFDINIDCDQFKAILSFPQSLDDMPKEIQ